MINVSTTRGLRGLERIRLVSPVIPWPRSRRTGWLAGAGLRLAAALVLTLLTVSTGRAAHQEAPAHGVAAESAASATGSQTLLTISCPSISVCYAGGNRGTILATRDGGATWQSQSFQPEYVKDVSAIAGMACPSVDNCFAYEDTPCDGLGARQPLLHTSNGGSSWVSTSIPGCGTPLACPDVATCYTVVNPTRPGLPEFVRTTDSGKSWQERARVDSNRLQESLACPTLTACYAAYGEVLARSTNGGKRWATSHIGARTCRAFAACPNVEAITCPGRSSCYAGGTFYGGRKVIAGVVATKDGFRTRVSHRIPGLHGISALSCPTASVCFALGGLSIPRISGWVSADDTGRFAVTTDAGSSWHVGSSTTPYPFDALACPSISVCYAGGFLGRLIGTKDGGATWHDLIPAVFVSGSYGDVQPLHTYSSWFTATGPWELAVGTVPPGPLGAGGRPSSTGCNATSTVAVDVRNAQDQMVAGPIEIPRRLELGGTVGRSTVQATGRLRLDVVSTCSSFSVRVDGVEQAQELPR